MDFTREDLKKAHRAAVSRHKIGFEFGNVTGVDLKLKATPAPIKMNPPTQEEIERQQTEDIERKKKARREYVAMMRDRHIKRGGKLLDHFKTHNETQKKALGTTLEFAKGEKKYMLLMGHTGTGKTHLASGYAFRSNAHFINAVQILPLWQEFKYPGLEVNEALLPQYTLGKLLKHNIIIDDLGSEVEDKKESVKECLKYIIDNCKCQLIITTNLSISALIERYGDKIMSRVFEDCEACEMWDTGDMRIKGKFGKIKTMADLKAALAKQEN